MTFNENLLSNYRTYPGGNWAKTACFVMDHLLRGGLQRNHTLIDVGCGPLRVGKHLIAYLDPDCYTGIEPEEVILRAGIQLELSSELVARQRPKLLVEPIGKSVYARDWALGWDVFNHLSAAMFRLALVSVQAKWLVNVHLESESLSILADGTGWSYRYADTKAYVYTPDKLRDVTEKTGYSYEIVGTNESSWPGHPHTILLLQPCSTPTEFSSSTSPEQAARG